MRIYEVADIENKEIYEIEALDEREAAKEIAEQELESILDIPLSLIDVNLAVKYLNDTEWKIINVHYDSVQTEFLSCPITSQSISDPDWFENAAFLGIQFHA